jgi:hypothetical protein
MKIQSTNSIKENKLKILNVGIAGSGKTFQTLKVQQAGYNVLGISAEGGYLSIAGTGIDYIDITKDDAGNLIPKEQRLNRLMEVYRYVLTKEATEKYEVLSIDGLTEISQCIHDALKKEFPDRKDSLVLYGELAQKSRDLIKAFRDIPHYHVIFTCLTKIEKDDNGKRYAGFDVIGSIADKLPGFFDEVIYIRTLADGTREFVCNGTDSIIAKDRSGKLSGTEPADLGAIFKKILKEK